jgi:Flp pilus assembly protein TadG
MKRVARHFERGASMTEFAVAATALLLLLFGIIQFGQLLYTYHAVSNAARLGARWAVVRGSACTAPVDHCNAASGDVQTYVRAQAPLIDTASMNVSATWSSGTSPNSVCGAGGTNAPGHNVCVTVDYPFHFALPFISNLPLDLSSTSKMVISE